MKSKLLIIDDSADVHELVKIWLANEPIDFTSCFDGEQALTTAPILRPDLILLDVDLPGINGFEICKRLKSEPATMEIPVLFITGASATEDKLRGLEMGAADYLVKPFDPAELRARVHTSLQTKKLLDLLAHKAQSLQESEARFRVLAENSSDVISRHAPDGTYLYVSPACAEILDFAPDRMIGKCIFDFIHPQDLAAVRECYSTPKKPEDTGTVEFRFRRNDGQLVWLESTYRTLTDPRSGTITEIHASARDIGMRKEMEHREQVRADVLAMIAQGRALSDILRRLVDAAETQEPTAVAAGVMLHAGVVHHCAPNLPPELTASIERQMYRILVRFNELAEEASGKILWCDLTTDPAWEELRPAIMQHRMRTCWAMLIRSNHRESRGAFVLYRRDELQPNAATAELLKLSGELISVAMEQRELADQLTFQAHHDALTQLPNRILFGDRLEQALSNAERSAKPAAVLLVDVDRFKYVNDTFGHQAGDEMLCQVAQRIRQRLRTCDALARMGGDEFAAILCNLNQNSDALAVANTLVGEFAKPIQLRGRDLHVSISIGSAVFSADATDASTLLMNADLALYRAKEAGRNTARAYTPDMSEGVIARMDMENALRQATAAGQLSLHYQPKVDTVGRLVGLEALLRWNHPTLGSIPPARFIPIAEETRLILPIGSWVLHEAARQARAWSDAGLPPLPIAVNVSALQFAQADFTQGVTDAVKLAGLNHRWLEIELTESLLMQNMRSAADKLTLLKAADVRVAIDDFGTGYSSLAYLQRLPLDTLKIDNSFTHAIDSPHGNGRAIIGAIVTLAKSLGLKIVAEGVERESEREFLIQTGCETLQGYLICPPLPTNQLEAWIRKQKISPTVLAEMQRPVAA